MVRVYKIFGFECDERFGRVAVVEFSIPAGGEPYAYLLGSFNAFNEGSFRMARSDGRWKINVELPEGLWYYAFSLGGEFNVDPENQMGKEYKRLSYKFEREASVAEVKGPGRLFHRPSLTYLYSFAGRTHILLRTEGGLATSATLKLNGEKVEMRPKAGDELFDYWEAVLPGEGALEYSFEVETGEGFEGLGPFSAVPERLEAPAWVLDRVFYQVMPDRFAVGIAEKELPLKGESFYGGDLRGLREHLGHLKALGINAIYLTPIFESMSYHGYDVIDYFHTAERLGGDGEFDALIRELKGLDVRLILDGVFHHTSFFHPYFQDVVRNGEGSRYRDFYRPLKFPVVTREFLNILKGDVPWRERYRTLKGLGWSYETFFSVWLMPRLNHDNPEVVDLIAEVMRYWLGKGSDGWRLDVAHGVPPHVWREVRKRLPKEAYIFGEVMDDGRLWLFDAFHGVMNYLLYDALLRFFVLGEIDARGFLNELNLLSTYYGPAEYFTYNFLDNHDVPRFLDLVGGDRGRYLCALAFLMTYKGIPALFYGDEIGLRGGGEGMGIGRTPMEWDEGRWDGEILRVTRALIGMRRKSRALQLGEFVPLRFEGGTMAYERVYDGEDVSVVIGYSRGREGCRFEIQRCYGGIVQRFEYGYER